MQDARDTRPTLLSLTRETYRKLLYVGIVFYTLGNVAYIILGPGSPGLASMSFGGGEIIIMSMLQILGAPPCATRTRLAYSTGFVFLLAGVLVILLQPIAGTWFQRGTFPGLSAFIIGASILASQYCAIRPARFRFTASAGVFFVIAGVLLAYFFGIMPSMRLYIFPALLPLISGLMLIAVSVLGKRMILMSQKFETVTVSPR